MTYEREYLPGRKQEEELEGVVRVLNGGSSEVLDVPDDTEEPKPKHKEDKRWQ